MALGFFHDFSRMNFGGNELLQLRTLTPQQVKRADEFHLEFVIAGTDLAAHAGALTGKLKIRWESGLKLHVLLYGLFLIISVFPHF